MIGFIWWASQMVKLLVVSRVIQAQFLRKYGKKTLILEVPGAGRLDSGLDFFIVAFLVTPHQQVPPSFWSFIPCDNLCQNACILLTFH